MLNGECRDSFSGECILLARDVSSTPRRIITRQFGYGIARDISVD